MQTQMRVVVTAEYAPTRALFLQLMDDERAFLADKLLPFGDSFIAPIKSAAPGTIVYRSDEQGDRVGAALCCLSNVAQI